MKNELSKLIESIDTDNILSVEQRDQLNTFGETIVDKMNAEREDGYKSGFAESKEIAESYVTEYETEIDTALAGLVESIDELISKREKLAVVEGVTEVNIELVEKLDSWLNVYVEETTPDALVVDYIKLNRLEKMQETLKNTLLITDDEVQSKVAEIQESVSTAKDVSESDLTLKTEQLQTEMENRIKVETELNTLKATNLLTEKTKDIPNLESKKLLKHFAESSVDEIESDFETVYENIKYKQSTDNDDVNLKYDKIKTIIESIKADDIILDES